MPVPINRLKKIEILWLSNHSCRHKHSYLAHYNCFLKENPQTSPMYERVAVLDIEAEDLYAEFGIMFCYILKNIEDDEEYSNAISKEDIRKYTSKHRDDPPKEDTRIVRDLISNLLKFDRVVCHFSPFDVPFVRTRAIIDGITFPPFGSIFQADTWRISKSKLQLRSYRLEHIHRSLYGHTRKDKLSLAIKHGCLRGEQWAIDDCMNHCKGDVLDTIDVYKEIRDFTKKNNSSI